MGPHMLGAGGKKKKTKNKGEGVFNKAGAISPPHHTPTPPTPYISPVHAYLPFSCSRVALAPGGPSQSGLLYKARGTMWKDGSSEVGLLTGAVD